MIRKYVYIFGASLLLNSCYNKIDTFYPLDKSKIIDGRTSRLINDSSILCQGDLDIVDQEFFSGMQLGIHIHRNGDTQLESLSFSIKKTRNGSYENYSSVVLTGIQNLEQAGEIKIDDLINVINEQEGTSVVFYFPNQGAGYDSLYLRCKVILKEDSIMRTIDTEEIFKNGTFWQPLSR